MLALRVAPAGPDPWVPGGPRWPLRTSVLATMFCMREIEAAGADYGDVHINKLSREVSWLLTVSKTDVRAKTSEVVLGCAAPTGNVRCCAIAWPPCPACSAATHLDELEQFLCGHLGMAAEALPFAPLFADAVGGRIVGRTVGR